MERLELHGGRQPRAGSGEVHDAGRGAAHCARSARRRPRRAPRPQNSRATIARRRRAPGGRPSPRTRARGLGLGRPGVLAPALYRYPLPASMPAPPDDTLCYGDCLDWMGRWDDATVDLIYLDPPFNSNANYNVLYARDSAGGAQTRAFVDTWSWDAAAGERLARYEAAAARPAHRAIVGLAHGSSASRGCWPTCRTWPSGSSRCTGC